MKKRLSTLEEIKELKIGDKVTLATKKGKVLYGEISKELTNRGYIDVNELEVYAYEAESDISINADKYLKGESSLKDLILN